ncbi:MAG: DUF3616 domain-containing protein [Candidatus Hydrogenedentes bacterium]|nr:DUF3616 domain-containing protein [Candidatus Hydrogenedentota bacterium]
MSRYGSPIIAVRRGAYLLLVAALTFAGGRPTQGEETGVKADNTPTVGAPLTVKERRMELSGCAVVDGGVLVVEDELIGAVLLLEHLRAAPLELSTVKLERKKKARAPYADAFKLFPFQDFEDIASDGATQVYFIGSHQGKDGERRPDREFLLHGEWDEKDRELKVVGEQYGLLEMIAPALERLGCAVGLSATEVNPNLNIEGLALNGAQLFIGFRAPLTADGKAILLSTAATSALAGKGTVDHAVMELDGGGIRALDWDPVRGRLLIISGASGEASGGAPSAALWEYDPATGVTSKMLEFEPELARKSPEGVCRLPEQAGGRLLVVLDGEGSESGAEFIEIED